MAIDTLNPRIEVTAGNGVTVAFDFDFKIFATTDIVAYKKSAAGVYTLGVLGVDYTVAFETDEEGGTVTWTVAPVSGGQSVILSAVPLTQPTELGRDTTVPAKTQETMFDRLQAQIQDLQDQLNRAALQPVTPPLPDAVVIEAPEEGMLLSWTAVGDTWHIEPVSPEAAAVESDPDAVLFDSGLFANRPATPANATYYHATDQDVIYFYSLATANWRAAF